MKRPNLRTRLTAWFALSLLLILAPFVVGVLALQWRSMREALDHHLEEDFEVTVEMLVLRDGAVGWRTDSGRDLGYDAGSQRWVEVYAPGNRSLYLRGLPAAPHIQRSLPSAGPGRTGLPFNPDARRRAGPHLYRGAPHRGLAAACPGGTGRRRGHRRPSPPGARLSCEHPRGRGARRVGGVRGVRTDAGSDRADGRAGAVDQRRTAVGAPACRESGRRTRPAGGRVQRDVRAARGFVRPPEAVLGQRLPRTADAADRDPVGRRRSVCVSGTILQGTARSSAACSRRPTASPASSMSCSRSPDGRADGFRCAWSRSTLRTSSCRWPTSSRFLPRNEPSCSTSRRCRS